MLQDKFGEIRRVLWIILFANIIVAIAKIILGMTINSTSILADGYHSLTDGSSNVIGLIGIWIAAKPKDHKHPYGHGKFETLTGIFIVSMLVFLGIKIVGGAIDKFMHPVVPQISYEAIIVMFVTLGINIFVAKYEYKRGKELNSTILVSDSLHTKSDIYITVGVILALVAIKLGVPPVIDPIVSLVVAGFIFHAAYEIFQEASGILVDSSAVENEKIAEIVMAHRCVLGVHKIRSRGTVHNMYIDMHVLADPALTCMELHQLAHEIENAIQKELNNHCEVIAHMEPYLQRD